MQGLVSGCRELQVRRGWHHRCRSLTPNHARLRHTQVLSLSCNGIHEVGIAAIRAALQADTWEQLRELHLKVSHRR